MVASLGVVGVYPLAVAPPHRAIPGKSASALGLQRQVEVAQYASPLAVAQAVQVVLLLLQQDAQWNQQELGA